LRYYERRGLLAELRRSAGGHRLYPAETVTVLRVIKAAQRLGFTLDEVADSSRSAGTATLRSEAAQLVTPGCSNRPRRSRSATTCALPSTPGVPTSSSAPAATGARSRSRT
jgi:DNA-binding transcriptional MerR regulator